MDKKRLGIHSGYLAATTKDCYFESIDDKGKTIQITVKKP